MIAKNIFLVLIFFSVFAIKAQHNYFNQKPPGREAVIFAPGIVTTAALEHASPVFSPDGKTVLWAIMKMPSYQICLLEMNLVNGQWSAAHAPSFSDSTASEVYPTFSPNGSILYFSSDRIVNSSSPKKNRLWYVKKTSSGWSEASVWDSLMLEDGIYANSISGQWNRYFSVGPQGSPDWSIFQSDKQGIATPLPPHINSPGYEDGPFIAPDESYLIFETDRPGTVGGSIDLYIAFRKKDGQWAEPINMGPNINTNGSERFAKVSADGKYLFFGRNAGNGFDIYWISAQIITDLKIQAEKTGMRL